MVKRFLIARVWEDGNVAISDEGPPQGAGGDIFDFLGLTHYCGTKTDGTGGRMKRVTARKKFL